MRVLNPQNMKRTFRCHYPLGDWLTEEFNLPPLNKDADFYWFSDTEELRNLLKIEPALIKLQEWLYSKLAKGG
jgi:hypothetical protein